MDFERFIGAVGIIGGIAVLIFIVAVQTGAIVINI